MVSGRDLVTFAGRGSEATVSKRTQRVRVRLRMPPGTRTTGPAHIRLSIDDVSVADRAAIPCKEVEVVTSDLDELMGPTSYGPP